VSGSLPERVDLLTVTLNPAIDRVLPVPDFAAGRIFRTSKAVIQAGGKGLNVARAAWSLGLAVLATGPVAGAAGRYFGELAAREEFSSRWISLPSGETRTATLIVHPPQDATVINESGPELSPGDWSLTSDGVGQMAERAGITVFSGSLPGTTPDAAAFGALLERLIARGRRVAVDTSGEALKVALRRPLWLLKVNAAELGATLGEKLETEGDICDAARQVRAQGPELVLVTAGAQGGGLASESGTWWATPPRVKIASTVGAGDSTIAGFCAAFVRDPTPENLSAPLRYAIATGTADTLTEAPGVVEPRVVEHLAAQVHLEQVG
jgi:1-phosphofructokinase family hexose kinase